MNSQAVQSAANNHSMQHSNGRVSKTVKKRKHSSNRSRNPYVETDLKDDRDEPPKKQRKVVRMVTSGLPPSTHGVSQSQSDEHRRAARYVPCNNDLSRLILQVSLCFTFSSLAVSVFCTFVLIFVFSN